MSKKYNLTNFKRKIESLKNDADLLLEYIENWEKETKIITMSESNSLMDIVDAVVNYYKETKKPASVSEVFNIVKCRPKFEVDVAEYLYSNYPRHNLELVNLVARPKINCVYKIRG